MKAFLRRGKNAVALLDRHERAVLSAAFEEVAELLDESPNVPTPSEADPALLRLLPDAAPSDPEVSEEFRRLTEADLRTHKTDRLKSVHDALSEDRPEWTVPLDEGLSTAAALTDVRLVIAARLGLETDEDAALLAGELDVAKGLLEGDLPEGLGIDHKRIWLASVYQALTWLQDSLIACLMDKKGGRDE